MGNVLRTAEALGVRRLALVGTCCDVYAPKVLRGSMGAVFRLGIRRFETAKDCLKVLRAENITSLAAVRTATLRPSRPFRLKRETGRCGSATRATVSQMKPSSIVMTA